jgi:anti-sigma factor RsiW
VDCDEFLAHHSEYLDGILTPIAAARLAGHATVCGACARYDRIVRKGSELVRDLPDAEPSEDFEMRLQHRIFHMEDARALQPRATSAAAALGVAAAIALLAWSPMLVRSGGGMPATATLQESVGDTHGAFNAMPLFSQSTWYPTALPAPAHQPSGLLAVFPGPYSPLVVTPPAHRSVRAVSAEYVID